MKKILLFIFICTHFIGFSQTIDLKKGLLVHYNFDNNSIDQSGNSNTLKLPEGVIFTKNISGEDNQAVILNNSPAKITLSKAPIYLPEYCISFWFQPLESKDSEELTHKTLFKNQDGCTDIYFDNFALNFDFSYKVGNGSGSASAGRGFKFEKDKWYFITMNFKEGKPIFITENDKTYKVDIDPIEKFGEFSSLLLLGANLEGKESFNGIYDDFRFYGRNLNQDEINELFLNKTKAPKIEPNIIKAPEIETSTNITIPTTKDSLIITELKPDLVIKKPDSTAKAGDLTGKTSGPVVLPKDSKINIPDSTTKIIPTKVTLKDTLVSPIDLTPAGDKPVAKEVSIAKVPEITQVKENLPIVETMPPVLTILSPDVDITSHRKTEIDDKIFISGTATDASGISQIKVNDKNVNFNNKTGYFNLEVPLVGGENTFKVLAYDQNKNATEFPIIITKKLIENVASSDPSKNSSGQPLQKRVALVIGNADYETSPLRNPVNDAKLMATELEKVGFVVTKIVNGTYMQIKKAISDLGVLLAEDKNTIGLFYYAGHGIQVKGKNFIVPIDAKIAREPDVEVYCVDLDGLLSNLEYSANVMNIIILDACRNNPFSRGFRSAAGSGLADIKAPSGTYIGFATSPGSTAADGEGENGVYTQEIVKSMKIPGIQIENVFKRVRAQVKSITKDAQVPWESSSLVGDFYFKQ